MLLPNVGMCVDNTPLEDYTSDYGLYVKREDKCCPGGPDFSKTRGVFKHVQTRPERRIGVLDTAHSQGGWAVAKACDMLGKQCIVYYAQRKVDIGKQLQHQQLAAAACGATLVPLKAGMSAVLYNIARRQLVLRSEALGDSYMMPNALKLQESVDETAAEVERTQLPSDISAVLISASSGTIAAGVIKGLRDKNLAVLVHLGYSRSHDHLRSYMSKMAGWEGAGAGATLIDENYVYADAARGDPPPWPCNVYYDCKAFNWWVETGRGQYGKALFWNVG